jgi:serine/threonine-protein kinase
MGTPVPSAPGSAAPAGTPVPSVSAAPVAEVSHPIAIAPDLVGTVLADRYRIIKKLGEGGMGSVYLAEHTTINKRLAIKVLSSEYTHKQDLVDRFLQEARAASMIEQENVVEITDFGSTPTGSVFFVMEFLNGEDLSHTIKKTGPLPWSRVQPIMVQICTALAAAHDVGIIHRDMKPENCYRIKRGHNQDFIKVLDFGIAKVTTEDGEGGKGLTRTGMIFGTPEYMSPEQAKGEKVDPRVDVYAVGVILYELLTGRVPFTADTFMGILTKHMFEAPAAPSTVAPNSAITPEIEAIILKALQKDREYRFQSMREMMEAIEGIGTGAAAVSVVAEDVIRPAAGKTRFSTTYETEVADDFQPKKSSVPLIVGVGLLLAALGGGAAWALSQGDKTADAPTTDPAATQVAAVGAPDADPSAGAATPEVEAKPKDGADGGEVAPPVVAPPAKVAVTVAAPGIEGGVYDERDDAELGRTNEAFEVPYGTESIGLYIRADGYEDQLASVIPDAEKTLTVSLTPEPAASSKGAAAKKKKKKKASGEPAATVAPEPKPKPKADPEPKPNPTSSTSPDLKNPFKRGG